MVRLLVAEDDVEMRALLKRSLSREGFEVEVACNGREALQLLQSRPAYDLLITDIRMPEKSGDDLITDVRGEFPDLKIVVVTGYSELNQQVALLQRGVFGYITKPFKIPELIELIDDARAMA